MPPPPGDRCEQLYRALLNIYAAERRFFRPRKALDEIHQLAYAALVLVDETEESLPCIRLIDGLRHIALLSETRSYPATALQEIRRIAGAAL